MAAKYCEKRRKPGESFGILDNGPANCMKPPTSVAMFLLFFNLFEYLKSVENLKWEAFLWETRDPSFQVIVAEPLGLHPAARLHKRRLGKIPNRFFPHILIIEGNLRRDNSFLYYAMPHG